MTWRLFFCPSSFLGGHLPCCELTMRLSLSTDFSCREVPSNRALHWHHCWQKGLYTEGRHSPEWGLWGNNLYLEAMGVAYCTIRHHSKQPKTLQGCLCTARMHTSFEWNQIGQLNGIREPWYNSAGKDLWTVFLWLFAQLCFKFTDV